MRWRFSHEYFKQVSINNSNFFSLITIIDKKRSPDEGDVTKRLYQSELSQQVLPWHKPQLCGQFVNICLSPSMHCLANAKSVHFGESSLQTEHWYKKSKLVKTIVNVSIAVTYHQSEFGRHELCHGLHILKSWA